MSERRQKPKVRRENFWEHSLLRAEERKPKEEIQSFSRVKKG